MNLAKTIRNGRQAAGETQSGLARALGVSKNAVQQWEASATEPTIALRVELAVLLRIELDDLLPKTRRKKGKAVLASPTEYALLELFRRLGPRAQKALIVAAEQLLPSNRPRRQRKAGTPRQSAPLAD